jgi:hypothetical protein
MYKEALRIHSSNECQSVLLGGGDFILQSETLGIHVL